MTGLTLGLMALPSSAQDTGGPTPAGGGADIDHGDDVLVHSLCASDGFLCANGENFVAPGEFLAELKLKDDFPAIWFDNQNAINPDFSIGDNGQKAFIIERNNVDVVTIRDSAPVNSLVLGAPGIGVNTASPLFPLHVRSPNPNGAVVAESTVGGPPALRTLFALQNNGPSSFTLIDTSPGGVNWFFRGSTIGAFAVDAQSTPTITEMFLSPGGTMTLGGSLIQGSSSSIKHAIADVDPAAVLETLRTLDVTTWSYDAEPGITHMGPMSEDFTDAFGLGANPAGIAAVDADGVAFAAIQALAAENTDLQSQVADLTRRNNALQTSLASLEARTSALEASTTTG